MLDAYQAESERLVVRYVDPDRRPADLLALQQKYGIEAGKTEDGHVVTDAAIIMSRAKGKPFFLAAAEMVDEGEDSRARSKLEQELTLTLRNNHERQLCADSFVTGHGEKRLEDGGPRGLGEFSR
jgi:hypothetical protein